MRKVFVLTHIDGKLDTSVLAVCTSEKQANKLRLAICKKNHLPILHVFITPYTLNKAL